MSEIYDLIVNHFQDLKAADYVLLIAIVVAIGLLLFRWIRTMYREPLEAQQAATAGWRDAAEAYQNQIESLQEQTGMLEKNIEQVSRRPSSASGPRMSRTAVVLLARLILVTDLWA